MLVGETCPRWRNAYPISKMKPNNWPENWKALEKDTVKKWPTLSTVV